MRVTPSGTLNSCWCPVKWKTFVTFLGFGVVAATGPSVLTESSNVTVAVPTMAPVNRPIAAPSLLRGEARGKPGVGSEEDVSRRCGAATEPISRVGRVQGRELATIRLAYPSGYTQSPGRAGR